MQDPHKIRVAVQNTYAQVAQTGGGCCGAASTCCEPGQPAAIDSTRLGYSSADLELLPAGADLGLGCGAPLESAALQAGETVLDLGSGAGVDCFLAARAVGERGRVIGVDMTPEMLHKARDNAAQGGYANVEFRLGEIEHLPVADNSVDVIISNCVVNLSPDKPQVFREAFRVLKSGGRLALSDVVARTELPPELRDDSGLYCGCMGGAATMDTLRELLAAAGFGDIRITPKDGSREFLKDWAPGRGIEDYVVSAVIEARKG
jgi:SAM-dependent methyltransferase